VLFLSSFGFCPVFSIDAFRRRTVLHGGFAAVQDDILVDVTFCLMINAYDSVLRYR